MYTKKKIFFFLCIHIKFIYKKNFQFRKIHECYKYNNCTSLSSDKENVEDAVLMIADGFFEGGNFISTILDQVYGGKIYE